MKDNFPGYFSLSDEDIKTIWNECIFTFDANVMLNMYGYSKKTRKDYFKILDRLKDRIWLSYHAAEEYLKGRVKVIMNQCTEYDKMIVSIKEIENTFKNKRSHPFISEDTLTKLINQFTILKKELGHFKSDITNLIKNDSIQNNFNNLFGSNIGKPFSEEEKRKIYNEGNERYKQNIPPGHKDENKKINKYGDLIIWKQIIKKSIEDNTNIVFITDETKEDWWEYKTKNDKIGPKYELINEFKLYTKKDIYFYSSVKFIEYAKEYLNESINENTIDEIRNYREYLNASNNVNFTARIDRTGIEGQLLGLIFKADMIKEKKEAIENQLSLYTSEIDVYEESYENNGYTEEEQFKIKKNNRTRKAFR